MNTFERYEEVMAQIRELFIQKNDHYGNSAFDDRPEIPNFQLWMRLSDVRRKTTRLDRLTDLASRGDDVALKKLIDDYKDLANYAIIAVTVLENLK